jgi:hypothetical protein
VDKHDHECVCDIVKKIARAQEKLDSNDDCNSSCKTFIKELVDPVQTSDKDTIPFILYCEGDCDPFIASGILEGKNEQGKLFYLCVETPIFRVTKVKDDCCAEVELISPVTQGGARPGPSEDGVSDVCKFFPGRSIAAFQRTGICTTINLNHFTGITCLPPVKTRPASQFKLD